MNSAADATKNAEAAKTVQASATKLTTPPPTSSPAKAPTRALSTTSSHTPDWSFPHATPVYEPITGTTTATPLALTAHATAPTLFGDLSNTDTQLSSQSNHLDESMVEERKKGDLLAQQRYDREKTIEHVLKQGKILKVCHHHILFSPCAALLRPATPVRRQPLPCLTSPSYTYPVRVAPTASLTALVLLLAPFLPRLSAPTLPTLCAQGYKVVGCLVLAVLVTALFGVDRVQGSLRLLKCESVQNPNLTLTLYPTYRSLDDSGHGSSTPFSRSAVAGQSTHCRRSSH